MKRKHVISTFALSALLGVGVFAGVRAHEVKETKAATETTVYCAISSSTLSTYTLKYNVRLEGGTNTWANGVMVDTGDTYTGGEKIYRGTFTDKWDGLAVMQFQLYDGETWKAQDVVFTNQAGDSTVWVTPSVYNGKLWVYGAQSDRTWKDYTPSNSHTVAVYVDGVKRGDESVADGLLPAAPTIETFGKAFSGWYSDSKMTAGNEVEAITSDTTVYGAIVDVPTVTYNLDVSRAEVFANDIYVYAFEGSLHNADWPGVKLTGSTFTVPNDATIIIANKDSEVTAQTVDVTQSKVANDTLRVLATKTGNNYNTVWTSELDEPTEGDGYYIVGTKTDWKFAGATKLTTEDIAEENVAELMNYHGTAGEKFKVYGFFAGQDPEKKYSYYKGGDIAGIGGADADENFVFSADGYIDIFAKWEGEPSQLNFYARAHLESYTVSIYDVLFEGVRKASTAETAHEKRATESINFEYEQPDMNGYVARGVYTDANCTTPYTATALTQNTTLYAKYTKLGYYMTGDATYAGSADLAWEVDGANYLTSAVNDPLNKLEGSVTIPNAATEENPVKVKALQFTGMKDNGKTNWEAAYYQLGEDYTFVEIDGEGNFCFKKGGTFAVYINQSDKVYFNEGAAAFYTKFLNDIGGVCDPDGVTTNKARLTELWAEEEAVYNSLSKDERDAIKAVGFNGGSETGDDLHKVIAKYHYIVTKYGTTVAKDFIWGQNYSPAANYNVVGFMNNDNTVVFAVIAIVSVISAAGLFFIIKRRRQLHK